MHVSVACSRVLCMHEQGRNRSVRRKACCICICGAAGGLIRYPSRTSASKKAVREEQRCSAGTTIPSLAFRMRCERCYSLRPIHFRLIRHALWLVGDLSWCSSKRLRCDSKLRCSEPPGTRAQIRPQARLPVFSPNPTSRPGTLGKISPSAAAGCWNQKTGPALLSLSLLCSLWLVRRCVFPNWGIHAHCLLVLQDCGFHHRVWRIARSPWCDKSMSQNTDRTFSCTVLNNARASAVGEQYDDPSVRWRLRTKSVWYSFGPANRRVC